MSERPMSMEMPDPARRETGAESKEDREAEPVRRSFEYRDADGNLLGVAEVALGAETVEIPYAAVTEGEKAEGRQLLSFVLRGEKDGEATEIDMLELANRHGVEVVSSEARLVNYAYSNAKKRAIVPPLETPLDIGVFLHELGHADQCHEDRFEKIMPLYGHSRQASDGGIKLSYGSMKELVEAVVDAVPEAAIAFDDESMAQLDTLEARRQETVARKSAAEKDLEAWERQRADALGEMIEEALQDQLDIGAFLRRCDAAAKSEGDVPPLVASPEARELRETLKRAGFMFMEQAAASLKEVSGSADERQFPAERGSTSLLMPEGSLTGAAQIREMLAQAVLNVDAAEADIFYDAADETLTLRAPVPQNGKHPSVLVRLHVDGETFARYARGREIDDREIRGLEKKVDAHYADAKDYQLAQEVFMDHIDVRAIAALPKKMIERDATRRALQWLRTVRIGAGVDLLKPHIVPPKALVAMGGSAAEGCVGSVAGGMEGSGAGVETRVLQDLKQALATYGADKLRLRRPDDDTIGITPVAGLDRTKKSDNS